MLQFLNGSLGLLERFSCSTSWAARHCKMQGSVRWNRDSEDRHLRLPSHGAAKGGGNWPAAVHCETAGPPFAYQSGVRQSGVERSELSIA